MKNYKSYTVEEATKALENYCAYQERCHKEVEKKLHELKMIPEAREKIILHLLQHNFLNEERFAKTFVRGKFRIKKWGKYRLTLELKKRGVSKHNINLAISQIPDSTYIEAFNDISKRKFDALRETNVLKKKKKLADYLLYRGWESHLVYAKVNELIF